MPEKIRLDKYVQEYLKSSRSEAQEAIASGKVSVNGVVVTKASLKVLPNDVVSAQKAHPYVSRAALKLKHALDLFAIDAKGTSCIDIGSSTGGFTDILLRYGAGYVYAIDVGTSQFSARLKDDPHIELHEQTDARDLTREIILDPIDIIVCDASFIGLEKVLWPALSFAAKGANLIALFKPQFQVGRKHVGKGGIVTDHEAVEFAFQAFEIWLMEVGWTVKDRAPSPITGSDGNQEWLVWATNSRA